MSKITISFKNTTRDKMLLDYINRQEEKSQFIKQAISYFIQYLQEEYEEDEN